MILRRRVHSNVGDFDSAVQVSAGFLDLRVYRGMPAGLVGFSLGSASAVSSTILQIVYEMNILKIDMQSVG